MKTNILSHRTVWRWHFYAGLFCIPFVLWLATTGTIYLFQPQVEAFLDRPYSDLEIFGRATANAQVQAALAAVPGAVFDTYELPRSATAAAQILVDKGTEQFRVYVHPGTLAVLSVQNEDHRLEKRVFKLHGELMMGEWGSWIVELAASWAVVMILTGLFLWWPKDSKGLAGVLYPRLGATGRVFWKDLHSVVGVWVSFFALFLLFTGLPWAKSWGGYLKAVRHFSAGHAVAQDWTTSSAEELAARAARTNAASADSSVGGMAGMASMPGMKHDMSSMSTGEHAEHNGGGRKRRGSTLTGPDSFVPIDRVIASVAPLGLAYPVLVSPPARAGGSWTAKSDTQDRPLRVDLEVDGATGAILKRTDFAQKPWLDRAIGTGIAAHEGALFGLANQLVSLLTVLGLVTLSLSGLMMWWRRKPEGVLGAPVSLGQVRFSAGLVALMVLLGVYSPFLGVSMILVAVVERFILRRIPVTRHWLGLEAASA
jgi:uncharacterized iron-regulated membrane protein